MFFSSIKPGSESENGSSTEEELDEVQDTNTAGGASRYLPGGSDTDDGDLPKRVVQPGKDKRFEEMVHTAEQMEAVQEEVASQKLSWLCQPYSSLP
ncbi:hypothetical protein F2Q69_00026754 [Brassica cretica]|uniref:Uncharacterized protein n=1 Tax=Brassica cretica TaxID=69181 RepID=A0A8S9RVQ8_BRACR|nr:hypothetical protein F2Q69_00026754 [Brassica cretica]